jgi:RHS repeat-associated protein
MSSDRSIVNDASPSAVQGRNYTQGWDADNHLIAVTDTVSGQMTQFYYDADGTRVKRADPTGTTVYIGQHFEVQTSAGISTSYYYFGAQRVAMRTGSTVYWLQGDNLGSASLTTNITGSVVSEQRYYPFGETRWVSGTMVTDRTFTGVRQESPGTVGSLADMNAREYSTLLGRFLSADSIVPRPGNPQSLNRFSYAGNSPLVRIDPNGHSDICNSALYNCSGGGSNDPAATLPSPTVVHIDPNTILNSFRSSHVSWEDIPADFKTAMVNGTPGFNMPGLYNDLVHGSAAELPWYEHPRTWAAGIVAGGYACVVFCGSAVAAIGTAWTSLGVACATSSICLQLANLVNGISGARSSSSGVTRLYRAVGEEEYQDILQNGVFREIAKSASGKYFATSAVDAQMWGDKTVSCSW